MAKQEALYTVAETSRVLGVSQKRIRQLIKEKKLEKKADNPVRVSQLQVLELRAERDQNPRAVTVKPSTNEQDLEKITENFTAMFRALEQASERNENTLREMLNDREQRIKELTEQLEQAQRRKLFKRNR